MFADGEKINCAVDRYYSLEDYELVDTVNAFRVYTDGIEYRFVKVIASFGGFSESDPSDLRDEFEEAILEFFKEHGDDNSYIYCDEVSLNIINEGRALLRQKKNAAM